MSTQDNSARIEFADRVSLLYIAAGNPPLKRVAQAALALYDEGNARTAAISPQRISAWRTGRNVPARFHALHAVLQVLIREARTQAAEAPVDGLYDVKAWRGLWQQALSSPPLKENQSPYPAAVAQNHEDWCPYRGLDSYRRQDSSWFFGREHDVENLIKLVTAEHGGLITLVGVSGAGKTSLLNAGLLPAVQAGALHHADGPAWQVVSIIPSDDPMSALDHAVPGFVDACADEAEQGKRVRAVFAEFAKEHGAARTLLIVDQLEDIFLRCSSPEVRHRFVRALHAASTSDDDSPPPAVVVAAMRADCYPRFLEYPEIAEALQNRQIVLGPMSRHKLIAAVTLPAKHAGLRLEPGLLELILRDVATRPHQDDEQGAYAPGALPLLSQALMATWQRRQSGKLTVAGYQAAGGLYQSLAATVEDAWARMNTGQRSTMRWLLMRLVHFTESSHDIGRRVSLAEVREHADDEKALDAVLEILASARIITLGPEHVELTHDVVLEAWPRYRDWRSTGRAEHLLQRKLEGAAKEWASADRNTGLLYRGPQLAGFPANGRAQRNSLVDEFLIASHGRNQRVSRMRTAVMSSVALLAVLAALTSVIAVYQWSAATGQRDQAQFDALLTETSQLEQVDPTRSALLDLAALRLRPNDPRVSSRLLSTQSLPLARPLPGHTGAVELLAHSRDGKLLASTGTDRTIQLWDVSGQGKPKRLGAPLTHNGALVTALTFNADSTELITAGNNNTVIAWDIADQQSPKPTTIPVGGTISSPAMFSADGSMLVTAPNGQLHLWAVDGQAGARERSLSPTAQGTVSGPNPAIHSVAFSPDGHTLAASSDDHSIGLWDTRSLTPVGSFGTDPIEHVDRVYSLSFSPDGRMLAAGSDGGKVALWDVSNPAAGHLARPPVNGHIDPVRTTAFSSDGSMLATGSLDGTVRIWSAEEPALLVPIGQPVSGNNGGVLAVAFNPVSGVMATGGEDTVTRLWSLPATVIPGHPGPVDFTMYSADGTVLVTRSSDNTIRLWDTADPYHPKPRAMLFWPGDRITLSPNGRLLASANGSTGIVQLWDVGDLDRPKPSAAPLSAGTRRAFVLSFSPDNKLLVAGHSNTSLQMWDVSDPAAPRTVGPLLAGFKERISMVKFAPDGRTLAASSLDGTFRLWNVANPENPAEILIDTSHKQPAARHGQGSGITAVRYSWDSRILATGSDNWSVQLWDITDLKGVRPLGDPFTGHTAGIRSMAFSPDGKTLATGSDDQTVLLWDISDPSRSRPSGESIVPRGWGRWFLAYSPKGDVLTAGGADGTLRVIDLRLGHAVSRICSATSGKLAEGQGPQFAPSIVHTDSALCAEDAGSDH